MPLFSVVIPLYNKELHIANTVKSVLAQTFTDFEIIIVNDGSTDNSAAVVAQLMNPKIHLFAQKNAGASAARNFGVAQATGKYIALLDADDYWENNHLQEFFKSIKKFLEASFFCNAYKLKLKENFTHNASYSLQNKSDIQLVANYFDASYIHPLAMTSGVAFLKKDFLELGGFSTEILSGQDFDLWIRFGLNKIIVFNPAITSCYDKTVAGSLSKENHRKAKYELFNRFTKEEKTNPSLKKYLDLNRYSVALHCKYNNDRKTLALFKQAISKDSLNPKQKFLLYSPNFVAATLKKIHGMLIENGLYLTAFK